MPRSNSFQLWTFTVPVHTPKEVIVVPWKVFPMVSILLIDSLWLTQNDTTLLHSFFEFLNLVKKIETRVSTKKSHQH